MPDELPRDPLESALLKSIGFKSYDDLVAARLSGYFRERSYALPAWPEQSMRRNLRKFEAAITPHSRMISFLGAGTYDFDQRSSRRLQDLQGDQPEVKGLEVEDLQLKYLTRSQALTGMRFVHPRANTLHEAWMNLIAWIVQVRPGRTMVLVAESVDPGQRHRLRRLLPQFGLAYEELPTPDGILSPALLLGSIHENTAAVIISSPNFFGSLESVSEIGQLAHQRGALFGVIVDLLSLYMLRTPEEFRANFCLADWRTLGVAPISVAERSWLWATAQAPEFEQTQELTPSALAITLTIAQALQDLDQQTVERRFLDNWNHAHYLCEALGQIQECRLPHRAPFFREFVVRVPGIAEELIEELEDQGIFAGVALSRDGYPRDWLLISASELLQATDFTYFLQAFKQALKRRSGKSV